MRIADMVLEDLPADFPLEVAGPVEALRGRAADLLKVMSPRVVLSNGSLGYKAIGRTIIDVSWGSGDDEKSERIEFEESPTEIQVHDPVLTLQGALRIDLEILSYVAEGVSNVLFDGEPVKLVLGKNSDASIPPSYGRLEIPLGVDFGNVPVKSVQEVFIVAETPVGRFRNVDAARMTAMVTKLPPIGVYYEQEGTVPLTEITGSVAMPPLFKSFTSTALIRMDT